MILTDFLQWMESATPAAKADAVRNLCRHYLSDEADKDTRNTIETVLTVCLDDPDTEVRYAIADVMGASRHTPRHLMFALAGDRADIAALVLARSPLFLDVELAEIVGAADVQVQIAVAKRVRLASSVCAAIAEVGEKPACLTLLANPYASVARLSFRRIAERFGGETDVRDALFAHGDLPPEVRQLLIRAIGNALGSLVAARHWLPTEKAKAITRDACERATIAIAAETVTDDLPALVEHLRATEQLTTALLLRSVCAGNIAFFETALSMLGRMPIDRVRSLIRGGRRSALSAVYGKARMPKMAFEGFAAALDAWRQLPPDPEPVDRYRFTIETVNTVLARYADITEGEANELAAMLRRFAADQAREAARGAAREAFDAVGEARANAPQDEDWIAEGEDVWTGDEEPVANDVRAGAESTDGAAYAEDEALAAYEDEAGDEPYAGTAEFEGEFGVVVAAVSDDPMAEETAGFAGEEVTDVEPATVTADDLPAQVAEEPSPFVDRDSEALQAALDGMREPEPPTAANDDIGWELAFEAAVAGSLVRAADEEPVAADTVALPFDFEFDIDFNAESGKGQTAEAA